MTTKLIDGRWYDVEWPHGYGTDVGVISSRYDGQYVQFRRYNSVPVSVCLETGYKFTPLVLASPQRIAALEYAIERADFSELRGPEVLAVLDAMLQEMKGEATDE